MPGGPVGSPRRGGKRNRKPRQVPRNRARLDRRSPCSFIVPPKTSLPGAVAKDVHPAAGFSMLAAAPAPIPCTASARWRHHRAADERVMADSPHGKKGSTRGRQDEDSTFFDMRSRAAVSECSPNDAPLLFSGRAARPWRDSMGEHRDRMRPSPSTWKSARGGRSSPPRCVDFTGWRPAAHRRALSGGPERCLGCWFAGTNLDEV